MTTTNATDNLFDAVATAAVATEQAISAGSLGNLVEPRIPELWDPISGNVMAEAGDQLKVWEITREYVTQLAEQLGPDERVKAVFPDAGCAAPGRILAERALRRGASTTRLLCEEGGRGAGALRPIPLLEAVRKASRVANERGTAVVLIRRGRCGPGDAGLGRDFRRMREEFLGKMCVVYCIQPLPWCNGNIFKRFPGLWRLYLQDETRPGRFKGPKESPQRLAGDDLDDVVMKEFRPKGEDGEEVEAGAAERSSASSRRCRGSPTRYDESRRARTRDRVSIRVLHSDKPSKAVRLVSPRRAALRENPCDLPLQVGDAPLSITTIPSSSSSGRARPRPGARRRPRVRPGARRRGGRGGRDARRGAAAFAAAAAPPPPAAAAAAAAFRRPRASRPLSSARGGRPLDRPQRGAVGDLRGDRLDRRELRGDFFFFVAATRRGGDSAVSTARRVPLLRTRGRRRRPEARPPSPRPPGTPALVALSANPLRADPLPSPRRPSMRKQRCRWWQRRFGGVTSAGSFTAVAAEASI